MQRVTEIPDEIKLINPSYEEIQLANGLAKIAPRAVNGKPVKCTLNLKAHPEAVRARIWQSVKNCIFGRILIEDKEEGQVNDAIDRAPVEGAENPHSHSGPIKVENELRTAQIPEEPKPADFTGIPGIPELTAKRINALGIVTYEQFLSMDTKALLRIEGITAENLDVIIAAVAAKIQVPDPATVNPPLPPKQIITDIHPGTEVVAPTL